MRPIKDKFILLFSPQPSKEGRRIIPLGLLAISSFLDQEGYDIRIFHSYDKEEYIKILEYLDQVICVGITSMTGYQIYDGLNFAKLIRKSNPTVPIIWGGIHPTINPIETIKNSLVDVIVKGLGEETFTELVHKIDNKEDYSNVLGITYKKDGRIFDNPTRPYRSINEYPSLPYHILGDDIERYIKKNEYANRNLAYITSTGCPFNCAFCCFASSISRKWDAYSATRVINEIDKLTKNYNLNGIELRDPNFFVNSSRVKEICQGLLDKNINIILSSVNGRAEQLIRYSNDDWELFKNAGIKEILIGAESGDQRILDLINKQSPVEAILECEKKAKQHGINIVNSFMTGFPSEVDDLEVARERAKQELDKTVDLIRDIFKINPIANILLFFYAPYPGTPLYELSLKSGFKNPSNLWEWSRIDFDKATPWVTKKHIKKVLLLRKLFVFKKITSQEHINSKKDIKIKIFYRLGLLRLLNYWIDFRLKYKFYFLPVELFFK